MRLILEAKYPKRKMLEHDGDSCLEYDSFQRKLDMDLEQGAEDIIEENEGVAEYKKGDDNQLVPPTVKLVVKTKGTFPNELAYDKKTLSKAVESHCGCPKAQAALVGMIRPSSSEVLDTARLLTNEATRAQLITMLLTEPTWLDEMMQVLGG